MARNTLQSVQNRIVALDVLRGFALFGVLLVNMLDFSSSALRAETLGARGSELDQIVDVAIAFFAITKFYLLFSFLFGVGFAVQMRRMAASGRPFVGFYLRRLGGLFLIGLAHAVLVWDGDILRLYAAAGVLLLVVRRWPVWALLALAGGVALGGLLWFGLLADASTLSSLALADSITVFRSGTYAEVVAYRLNQPMILDIQVPMVFVMFLLGLVAGRSGLLDEPARYQPLARRWWKWALPVGLAGNALMMLGYADSDSLLISLGVHVGAPALSFVYACWGLLFAERLAWLAPGGQMALTNYLSQSLVSTTLFYGYGFGLYDTLMPAAMLLVVCGLFGAQVLASRLWMRWFRFGPVEWLWRSWSYGQWQVLQRLP
jgi:uncharacterized protein